MNAGLPVPPPSCGASHSVTKLFLAGLVSILFLLPPVTVRGEDAFDPSDASLDELMYHASRYGSTDAKRAAKKAASEELLGRGLPAFRYLVENVHMENMWFYIYARKMLKELPDEDAAEMLVGILRSRSREALTGDQEKDIRRVSVFFLGFCDSPQYSEVIRPFLDDEEICGVAARTLGKWQDRDSVKGIISLLEAEKEARRIQAAVALGKIADTRGIDPLIGALSDRVCTVRNSASKSLVKLPGEDVGKAIMRLMPGMSGAVRRQAVRILGEIRYKPAEQRLMDMLLDGDPWLCGDAVLSLRRIGVDLTAWKEGRGKSIAAHPFVKSMLTCPAD